MAMIYQASAGVANAKKLTISMWCRAHTTNAPSPGGDTYSLIEFGTPIDAFGRFGNYIQLLSNMTDGTNGIFCQFSGKPESVDGLDICTSNLSTADSGTLHYKDYADQSSFNPWPYLTNSGDGGVKVTPYCMLTAPNPGSAVAPEKWFHLIVAIDASHESTYDDPFSINKFYLMINGTVRSVWSQNSPDVSYSNGNFIPRIYSSGDTFYRNGPFKWIGGTSGEYVTNGVIPPFEFDLSGMEIGIPSQRTSLYKNTQLLDMADVQIWVDKFIDPTILTNFEKFVEVVDGRGSPVNPNIAADYFGSQTYLFKGQRDDFLINNGMGGAFSYSGTVTTSSGVGY